MKPVILATGHAASGLRARRGDYPEWFAAGLGRPIERFAVLDAPSEPPLPDPALVDGLLITGSAASVHHRARWSVRAGEWAARVIEAGAPVLGVCYGHQLIGDALGGVVGPNPNGFEAGRVAVELFADDPLFADLPRPLPALQMHGDAVLKPPPGARVLAGNAQTPVQALAIGDHVRTVQWHPEIDADILHAWLDLYRPKLGDARTDAAARTVADAPSGPRLLVNFARHFMGMTDA